MGVDAPVLASVRIAKNAQLVAEIKYINFGMEEALNSSNILYVLPRLSNKLSQIRSILYDYSRL